MAMVYDLFSGQFCTQMSLTTKDMKNSFAYLAHTKDHCFAGLRRWKVDYIMNSIELYANAEMSAHYAILQKANLYILNYHKLHT